MNPILLVSFAAIEMMEGQILYFVFRASIANRLAVVTVFRSRRAYIELD